MPWTSIEMRWFVPGEPSEALSQWFLGTRLDWKEVESRIDVYLELPGIEDMGLKAREGRLENKGRLSRVGPVQVTDGASGWLERWCKWSYEARPVTRALQQHAPATRVTKRRIQRPFRLVPGEDAQEKDDAQGISRLATLELCRLEVGGRLSWSLAAEAGPAEAILEEDLLRLLRQQLDGCPVELEADASMGYPEWLSRLDWG